MICTHNEQAWVFLPDDVWHFGIVADPSCHSNRETLVSLIYSWENDLAACGVIQLLSPIKQLTLAEQDMPDEISRLASEKRQARVSAFKQLQGISNQLSLLTQGRHDLDSMTLPEDFCVRPLEENEVRYVEEHDGENYAYIYSKTDNTKKRVLPEVLPDNVPLCAIGLDQGSIGAAGIAFVLLILRLNIWPKFDKVHRVIRDISLSLKHCWNGIFLLAQLFSAYIFELNYKPFNSGEFFDQKKTLLNAFVSLHTVNSELFQKYCDRIAADLGMPCGT